MQRLEQFGNVPIDYSVLRDVFSDYKFPRNKIAILESEGQLIRLKKGVYVVSPDVSKVLLSTELIANQLYGPSYISLESALYYYGLIPEYVPMMCSVTTNRSAVFENQVATFQYRHVDKEYYSIGITLASADNRTTFMIASPEKALCDMIVTKPRLRLQSEKALIGYIEDDLRMDMDVVCNMDISIIEECAQTGKKKNILSILLNLLKR
jgi:predicted transcriptional regulator of viral defense system